MSGLPAEPSHWNKARPANPSPPSRRTLGGLTEPSHWKKAPATQPVSEEQEALAFISTLHRFQSAKAPKLPSHKHDAPPDKPSPLPPKPMSDPSAKVQEEAAPTSTTASSHQQAPASNPALKMYGYSDEPSHWKEIGKKYGLVHVPQALFQKGGAIYETHQRFKMAPMMPHLFHPSFQPPLVPPAPPPTLAFQYPSGPPPSDPTGFTFVPSAVPPACPTPSLFTGVAFQPPCVPPPSDRSGFMFVPSAVPPACPTPSPFTAAAFQPPCVPPPSDRSGFMFIPSAVPPACPIPSSFGGVAFQPPCAPPPSDPTAFMFHHPSTIPPAYHSTTTAFYADPMPAAVPAPTNTAANQTSLSPFEGVGKSKSPIEETTRQRYAVAFAGLQEYIAMKEQDAAAAALGCARGGSVDGSRSPPQHSLTGRQWHFPPSFM